MQCRAFPKSIRQSLLEWSSVHPVLITMFQGNCKCVNNKCSQEDYLNFPTPFFLVLLRDDSLLATFKFHLLRLWAGRHEERKEDIFTLVMALPFKGLADVKVRGVGVTH